MGLMNYRSGVSSPRETLLAGLFAAASLFVGANAQLELCSCNPESYTFTFDFSLTCPPVDVNLDGDVSTTVCQISPFGSPGEEISNLVPVRNIMSFGIGNRYGRFSTRGFCCF